MAKKASTILGIIFILVGVIGFFAPGFLGTHLSVTHNFVHLVSGALALYFGRSASLVGAKRFCIIFGIFYLLLGIVGFIAGSPAPPSLSGMTEMGTDSRLFRLIPGYLELGTMDHLLHVVLGLIFLIAGMMTKADTTRPAGNY